MSSDEEGEGAGDDVAPRRPAGPSTRMALIVLGIAATLTVVGSVASGLSGGSGSHEPQAGRPRTAEGSPLVAESSQKLLAPIVSGGLPPSDIVEAMPLPRGSDVVGGSALDSGVGLYDRSLSFTVPASEQEVIEYFRAQLRADLWKVLSSDATGTAGAYRILAQHPGSNGYEWELGVTVMPETFGPAASGPSPPGSSSSPESSSASGTAPYTLRLFEVSDEQ
jgi:hypothetical protein